MDDSMVITRIPPSPTGHLHIGTVRTALFNFLYAQHCGGKMVFRSEDTDRSRSTREFESEIMAGLNWLGLQWDNTDIVRQSERGTVYREKLESIIASGHAYISSEPSKHDETKTVEVVRLKNPNKNITFTDLVRGDITFNTTELGDIVIARSLDDALYHFTVVVDDALMGVTHVIRGEDHVSNTPRQILIQEALGFTRPHYAHLPLILAPDHSKLSKRHGAVALNEYRAQGFTKEAIINYLALLGWNPGTEQEIFTLTELIAAFSLEKIQKSGAIFNLEKFKWFNRQHLNTYSDAEFFSYLFSTSPTPADIITNYDESKLRTLVPLIRERVATKQEFIELTTAGEYDFAFMTPEYDVTLLHWKNDTTLEAAVPRLMHCAEILTTADFSSPLTIKTALTPYAEREGKGEVLWPLRVALSGKKQSPDPFIICSIIGKTETIARLSRACDKIKE